MEGERSRVFCWHDQTTPPPLTSSFFPSSSFIHLFVPSPLPLLLISMIECPLLLFFLLSARVSEPAVDTSTLLSSLTISLPAKQAGGWSHFQHPRSWRLWPQVTHLAVLFTTSHRKLTTHFDASLSQRLSSCNQFQH